MGIQGHFLGSCRIFDRLEIKEKFMKKAFTFLVTLVSLTFFLTLFVALLYPAVNAEGSSPKQQLKEGKAPTEVACAEGLELVIRTAGDPACVKPETAQKLVERGMAQYPAEPPAVAEESALPSETVGGRTFVVVPEESKASYIVDEEFLDSALDKLEILPGPVTAVGTTQQVEGHLQLNSNDLTDPQVLGPNSFTVNIESLTSDDERRDDRIREHNLESSIYPLATFTATSIDGAPAEYAQGEEISFQLLGYLTAREITLPITFDVTTILTDDTIEGKMSTNVQMTDFGFDPPDWAGIRTVENDFTIEVEFKMVEDFTKEIWVEEPAESIETVETGVPGITITDAIEAEDSSLATFAIISTSSRASYITREKFFGGAIAEIGFTTGGHETVGSTQQMLGQIEFNPDDLSLGRSYFAVLISSLQSNLARRDETIRESDLESSRYPVAEFTAKSIENLPADYQKGEEVGFDLLGDITIREITQPVTFDVTATVTDENLEGVMIADLRMTDFGFNPPNWAGIFEVEDDFQIEVEFAMNKRDAWDESIASSANIVQKLGIPHELLTAEVPAAPEGTANIRRFEIIPESAKASYFVQEEFLAGALEELGMTVGRHERTGSTSQVAGQMILDTNNLSAPLGPNHFTVQIESLTSDEEERDETLREEWLESSRYPFATLIVTAIEDAPENYEVGEELNFIMQGDLTIREVTQPTAFDVTATIGSKSIEGVMEADLRMTDFGFDPPSWAGIYTVDDDFRVQIEFEMAERGLDLGPPPSE